MKTKRLFLLLIAAGLLLCSCTEKVFVPFEETIRQDNKGYRFDYTVKSNEWELFGDSYRAILDVPEITARVVSQGNVLVSRRYPGENNGADIWTPLPCIRTGVVVGEDGSDYYYTTYIDYEWTTGMVSIFVTASDLYTGDVPGEMYFRVFITQ